jgi:prepilin-type N-terminal cleavage/methylation domain-containing protein
MFMNNTSTRYQRAAGFSLIEMAIVLFIVALLLGGLLPTVSSQMELQRRTETRKQIEEIQQSLLGFVIINGRLPCPASITSNGQESFCTNASPAACGVAITTPVPAHGRCSNPYDGFVPAANLGITHVDTQGYVLDGWSNRLHYAVSDTTLGATRNALTVTNGIKTETISSFSTATFLNICASATVITPSTCGTALKLTDNAPALIFSGGSNGGTITAGIDEAANTNGDKVFVSHDISPAFDDLLVWISPNVLINRMVSAGQLP